MQSEFSALQVMMLKLSLQQILRLSQKRRFSEEVLRVYFSTVQRGMYQPVGYLCCLQFSGYWSVTFSYWERRSVLTLFGRLCAKVMLMLPPIAAMKMKWQCRRAHPAPLPDCCVRISKLSVFWTVQEGVECHSLCPKCGAVTITVYCSMCSGLDCYQICECQLQLNLGDY